MIDRKIRDHFRVFKTHPELVYLDSAASALKVDDVVNMLDHYYNDLGANVHRGAYELAYETTRLYEEAREKVAAFLNAKKEEIVFTKGTTSALNLVANGYLDRIQENDEIIVSELEHHSSLLPWMQVAKKRNAILKYIPLDQTGRITVEGFKTVLSNKTKVVAITGASNVLGYVTPIQEIIELAHQYQAVVVIDAAQLVTHQAIDVKALQVDYLAFSGHKVFGPSGIGVLYGKQALLDQLEPFEYGGEMVDQVDLEHATWKSSPLRFEAGTPVISGAIALPKALEFIKHIGYLNIKEHTEKLRCYALTKLERVEGVAIYNKTSDLPIIAFNIDDVHPHDVATFLDSKGISVRAGHHCAQLVSKWLEVVSTVRASFSIYNTYEDCDRLIEAIVETRDFFRKF